LTSNAIHRSKTFGEISKLMKVALVHDWLTGFRGGERVLLSLCRLYPKATIYTLLHREGSQPSEIERMEIRTSFIQWLPFAGRWYRHYLPFFPMAVENLDLRSHDLVISSSHCVAKGVLTAPDALHLCYCHTPMRYIWDMYHQYFNPQRLNPLSQKLISLIAQRLRFWDRISCERVDYFMANSRNVARRISRHYQRESVVIPPPVDVDFFTPSDSPLPSTGQADDYYLMVSALSPYKQVDLAIKTFSLSGDKLRIIGFGPELKNLRRMAGPNVSFLGVVTAGELLRQYRGCRALIFPGEEDFGLAPLEAQACGRPVVALGKGGALETVIPGKTGVFFHESTPDALLAAVDKLRGLKLNSGEIRENALLFTEEIFRRKVSCFIQEILAQTVVTG